jgi:hypothetical protein
VKDFDSRLHGLDLLAEENVVLSSVAEKQNDFSFVVGIVHYLQECLVDWGKTSACCDEENSFDISDFLGFA